MLASISTVAWTTRADPCGLGELCVNRAVRARPPSRCRWLAKFYLSTEKTFTRKIYNLVALKIESQLSKAQILEVYMKQIYLGNAHMAPRPASLFRQALKDITIAEAAMLAGLTESTVGLQTRSRTRGGPRFGSSSIIAPHARKRFHHLRTA